MVKKYIDIYLSDKKKIKIQDSMLKWTPQAIDCYYRNCKCQGCEINEVLETQCVMKHIVGKIFEIYGCPPVDNELEQAS